MAMQPLNVDAIHNLAKLSSSTYFTLFFPENKKDFVQLLNGQIISLIDKKIYNKDIQFTGVSVSDINSIKKQIIIGKALKVHPELLNIKNKQHIINAYKQKLLKFIKRNTGTTPANFSIVDVENVENISDGSVLLQYFPRDKYFYKEKLPHCSKIKYLDFVRNFLYTLYYHNIQPFEDLYDNDLLWLKSCYKLFDIPELVFTDFSANKETNPKLLDRIKCIWLEQIKQTYEKALSFLIQEKESATQFNDTDTLREVNIIIDELNNGFKEAKKQIEERPTVRDVLRYWPEILMPAPPQYSHR